MQTHSKRRKVVATAEKNEKKQWFWFDGGTEQEQHSTLLSLWMDEYHISIYLVLHKTLLIISISFCCLHVFSSFSHTHAFFPFLLLFLRYVCTNSLSNSDCSCVCFPFCKMCVSSFRSFSWFLYFLLCMVIVDVERMDASGMHFTHWPGLACRCFEFSVCYCF